MNNFGVNYFSNILVRVRLVYSNKCMAVGTIGEVGVKTEVWLSAPVINWRCNQVACVAYYHNCGLRSVILFATTKSPTQLRQIYLSPQPIRHSHIATYSTKQHTSNGFSVTVVEFSGIAGTQAPTPSSFVRRSTQKPKCRCVITFVRSMLVGR